MKQFFVLCCWFVVGPVGGRATGFGTEITSCRTGTGGMP